MEDSFIQKDIPIIHIFIHLLALFNQNLPSLHRYNSSTSLLSPAWILSENIY